VSTEVQDLLKLLKGIGIDTIPKVNWKDIMPLNNLLWIEMPPKLKKILKKMELIPFN